MMSSVIPARLLFQCGHAALVTLPRVKGETATQRNDRVAREKSAALARQCDFCAPTVQVVTNGDLHSTDVVAIDPIESLAVVVSAEPEPELEPVVLEVPPVVEELPTLNGYVHVEEQDSEGESLPAADVAEPTADAEPVAENEPQADAAVEPAATTESQPRRQRRTRAVQAPRKRRATRTPAATTPAATTPAAAAPRGYQFVVEYRVERVVRASDIRDALRQVNALGAADVAAITRAD
jgi:hypothetical protein